MADQYTDNIMMDTAPPTQNETIDIGMDGTTTLNPPLSPEVLSKRASIANYGLSDLIGKPFEYIRNAITKGNESGLRAEAASTLDKKKADDNLSYINEIAAQPLTDESKKKIFDLATKPVPPTDPNSVIEDAFAVKYVNNIYTVNSNPVAPKYSWLQEIGAYNPELLQRVTDLATEAASKTQYSIHKQQEAEERISQQPWLSLSTNPRDYLTAGIGPQSLLTGTTGTIPDIVKGLLQARTEAALRGNVRDKRDDAQSLFSSNPLDWIAAGIGPQSLATAAMANSKYFSGGFLGEHLEKEKEKLYLKSGSEYRAEYDRIMDRLYSIDPHLAAQWASAMTGQSLREKTLTNVFSAGAPLEAFQGLELGLKAAQAIRDTQMLGKNMVRLVPEFQTQPPSVAAATGVGDLGEAAVQRVTLGKIKELSGITPHVQDGLDTLTSNFKIIDDQIHANPGNHGTAMANDLTEMLNAGMNNFAETVSTLMRVNRTPVATATEDGVRMTKDIIRGQHKGIDNSILDIRGPFPDPVSGVPYYENIIGTTDKEFFKDRATAIGSAKLNGLVLRPTVYQEFNRLNQAIAAARKAGQDVKPFQAQRTAFQEQYRDLLKDKNNVMPNTTGATIVENTDSGAGFYIKTIVPNPEKADITRSNLITKQASNVSEYKAELRSGAVSTSLPTMRFPDIVNAVFNGARTPEETLSASERVARKIVDNTPKRLVKLIENEGRAIEAIPKGFHQDFERILTLGQHKTDPDTGLPGYFFKSPAELDYVYMQHLQRLPQASEVRGYFTYVKLMEYDRMLREMASYRNKAINSVEQVQFTMPGNTGAKSGFFEATRHPNFPGGKGTIAFIGDNGKVDFYHADTIGAENRKFRDNQVQAFKEGKTEIWRIWDTDSMPLKNLSLAFEDKRVEYVVVPKGAESKPIAWNTIPRRGGGHLTPDYDHYLKQGIVNTENVKIGKENKVRNNYIGDRTIMPIDIHSKGVEIADGMNAVRERIKAGDWEGARQAHLDKQLPMDWDLHKSWYKESHAPNGDKLPPRLDPKQPIHVVPKDKLIGDIDKTLENQYRYTKPDGNEGNSFVDGTKSGNPSRLATVEFTGPRDSYELYTVGDGGRGFTKDPLYSYQPAKYVDPITSMDRGLARIINSNIMDDYKQYAAEHWLAQAEKWLKASRNDIRTSPLAHFHDPEPYKTATPKEVKWILESARRRAMDFIGRSSELDAVMHRATTVASDSIYGATASSKAAIVPYAMLPYVRNPVSFLRSWATSIHLGFYNVRSFANQLGTLGNIIAITPRHAISGSWATSLYAMSKVNRTEEMMAYFDKMASSYFKSPQALQTTFKPGQWLEATKLLQESGFNLVGGEHAFLDTKLNVNLTKTWFDKYIKDWGFKPFEWGSQATKVSAWYSAYLEYREANPLKTLTERDGQLILERASTLDHNMTRSANSTLHTGYMAVPGQFQSYSLRTAELMFGKRLSIPEKLRLATFAGMFYGLPVGLMGSLGISASDYMKKSMIDKGVPIGGSIGEYLQKTLGTQPYVVGNNLMVSTSMEGVLALMIATITGGGNPHKGTWYDTSRFFTKGVDLLTNAMFSDKPTWQVLGNILASDALNISKQTSGIMSFLSSVIRGDSKGDSKYYEPSAKDLWDMVNIVSEGDAIRETLVAIQTGKLISKNGTYQGAITLPQELIKHIIGITPTHLENFSKTDLDKAQRDNEVAAGKEAARQFTRFMINDQTGNKEEAEINRRNMVSVLRAANVRSSQVMHFLQQAVSGRESEYLRINFDYYTKYAKDDEMIQKLKAYQTEIRLRGTK